MAKLELRHAKDRNLDLKSTANATLPHEDLIPFVCHYDPNTIITKNGELMQVIRITGFNHESISSELVNLREAVRNSISRNIKSSHFALWLHTIRRKKDIAPDGNYDDHFSDKLNSDWNRINDWKNQFVNELYLTIIIEGADTSIANGPALFRSLSPKATARNYRKELEKSHQTLSQITDQITKDLDEYGAKVTGIKKWDGVLYSEPMRFFGKIMNLCEDRYPLVANDLSDELSSYKIAFGNQSLEVLRGEKKNFGSMFSIKEYREVSIASLDKFLQLPQEFIVTQSLDFIDRKEALSQLEYQNYILEVSGDEEFRYLSDIERTIADDTRNVTDYAQQQITVMLINDTIDGLAHDIKTALKGLHNLGLVTIREDIFSQHCFWSQLPGNFQFLRRQRPISISRIAGFASLHNFPAGNRSGNHWGKAVTIFRTILGTPYFFNFHNGSNGHTLIAGPLGSGKTILLNFLVCQSRKFKNKLYYFGYNQSGRILINALNGNYLSLKSKGGGADSLKMNPLSLPATKENQEFLCEWFKSLVLYGKNAIDESELELIPEIVEKIVSSRVKKLSLAVEFFKKKSTKNIYHKLSIWHTDGKYAFIFDNEDESDLSPNLINAFNLESIITTKALIAPVTNYLLFKIESLLDNSNAMIVLDEAWKMIDNYLFGSKINDWLARLKEKNCMVIFATESAKDASQSSIIDAINHNIATQIFLPDPDPTSYYQDVFGLNEEEFQLLSVMNNQEHHLLLKHDQDSVVASLDLANLENDLHILSSSTQTIEAMNEAIKESESSIAKDWLPKFYELTSGMK
jgi:type IV secretion system protein VirB4